MYRILIFFVCCFLIANNLQAQNPFIGKDSLIINGIVYDCWNTSHGFISVSDKKSPINQEGFDMKRNNNIDCWLFEPNYAVFDAAIATVLTPAQRATFKQHKFSIHIYIKPATGLIQEMYFYFKKDCPVSAEQIYALEQALKGKQMNPQPDCVSMTFTAIGVDL